MRKTIWTKNKVVDDFLDICDGEFAPFASDIRKKKSFYYGMYKYFDGYKDLCSFLNKKPRYAKYYSIEIDDKYFLVKSELEVNTLIFLLSCDFDFNYEKRITDDNRFLYDFFLTEKSIYIECVGLLHIKSYSENLSKKKNLYIENNLNCVYVFPKRKEEEQFLEIRDKIGVEISFDCFVSTKNKCKINFLKRKYEESVFWNKFKNIYTPGILLKDISKNYPDICRYILVNYGTYQNFLITHNLPYKKRRKKIDIDCFEEYGKIEKSEGYRLNKTELSERYPWLIGQIQRGFGCFGLFCSKYKIIPKSDEMRGISFRRDKKLKKPWRIRLSVNGKIKTFGSFEFLDLAIEKRNKILFE